jgi:anti-sigma factor ChrR (cupin superfamily)
MSKVMSTVVKYIRPAFVNDDAEEEINADYSVPVVVNTAVLDWQSSPAAGVVRKRLELVGRDKPRLTTLVQFAPGSSFNKHGHDGGEEFLVLSGIFSDADGDYGPGSYVRNPPGTSHAPYTDEGCKIFVKLRQFHPLDREQLVVDSRAATTRWSSTGEPGISQLKLHQLADEQVSLYRILPQCWLTPKLYKQGLEVFAYEGSISDAEGNYPEGTWLRYPAGSKVKISSAEGARIYIKQGASPVN